MQRGMPHAEWDELRRTAPVWWQSQPKGRDGFPDEGHWVLTRHADVKEVSRRADVFSNWENTAIVRFHPETPREDIEMQRVILLNMDAPQHTRMRSIVSRGFTPRAVNSLKDALSARAQNIVQEAIATGAGDFVTDVACELPLQAIAELLGVPQEDRLKLFHWSNSMIGYDDSDDKEATQGAMVEMITYFMELAEDRKACPANDIVTKLVTADIDGQELTSDEFAFFTLVLSVAGNETTRNAITHGMVAFLEHPEQWELYKRERPETAADEIVRWSTPVVVFQRTAKEDVELGGQQIKAGDRVGMYYAAANFDPEVFDDPYTFDITARPESAPGLRRHRAALLHRREPRAHGDQPDLQRHRRSPARHRPARRPGAVAVGLAERDQVAAGRVQVPGGALTDPLDYPWTDGVALAAPGPRTGRAVVAVGSNAAPAVLRAKLHRHGVSTDVAVAPLQVNGHCGRPLGARERRRVHRRRAVCRARSRCRCARVVVRRRSAGRARCHRAELRPRHVRRGRAVRVEVGRARSRGRADQFTTQRALYKVLARNGAGDGVIDPADAPGTVARLHRRPRPIAKWLG